MKNIKGFTLIETLIYLALFGILMGAVSVAAYSIIQAGDNNQALVTLQQEGNFLLAKFSSAFNGATDFAINNSALSLSITNPYAMKNPLVFNFVSGKLVLQKGDNPSYGLNSDNTQMSNLVFLDLPVATDTPKVLKINFTLSSKTSSGNTISQDFETIKYLFQ